MLFEFTRFFKGWLYVRLEGGTPERFFNLCANHNILIWNIKQYQGYYEFSISLPAFLTIRPLVRKTHTKVRIQKRQGMPFFMHRYRKRKMFVLGLIFCAVMLGTSTRYIWCIQITGNSIYSSETIGRYLNSQGYYCGALKSKLDCNAIEEDLRLEFPDIIWVSARINGTKFSVEVKESLLAGKSGTDLITNEGDVATDENVAYDIVATEDGTIDHLITRRGCAMIRAGDQVKKGDILVNGMVPICSDDGVTIDYIQVMSDADIFIRRNYNYKNSFSLVINKHSYTGRQLNVIRCKFAGFSLKIPFGISRYDMYDTISESFQLHFFEDLYLPVWIERTVLKEYSDENECIDERTAKHKAQEQFNEDLRKLEEKGVEILKKNVIIDIVGNDCRTTGDLEVVERTGGYRRSQIINLEEGQAINEFN